MHIVLIILRHIIVEHCFHIIHINPACRHIRRNKNIRLAIAERTHHAVALLLLQIPVQALRKISARFKRGNQLVHLALCITKNQGQLRRIHIEEPGQRVKFCLRAHLVIVLFNLRDG